VTAWLPSVLAAFTALAVAALSTRQAARAARRSYRIEREKVDGVAFERAKEIYEAALAQLQKELDRLQGRYDEMSRLLGQERDVSNRLRAEVTAMRAEMDSLQRTLAALRRQMVEAGIQPLNGA
jgi:TolA-binding protein